MTDDDDDGMTFDFDTMSDSVKIAQLRLMENISENYWAAGWMSNLEYMIWAMNDGDMEIGDAKFVHDLARLTGGWWIWDPDSVDNEHAIHRRFVPMDEWEQMVAAAKVEEQSPTHREEMDAKARAMGFPDHESYAWDQIEKGNA